MSSPAMARVLVVQRRMTHYRVPLFETLRRELARECIELQLAYGEPTPDERAKRDGADIAWAHRLPTRYLCGGRLCWQPLGRLARGVDAVVVTAENKLLANLALQLLPHRARVLLWGHGANLQGRHDSWREAFKRRMARHADWWLGYTEASRPLIESSGFPRERITILDNAVDTRTLAQQHAAVTPAEREAMRARLGLRGERIGLFIGSLYAEKRLDLLLEAALALRERVPGFELLIVGDGPQAAVVQAFCARHDWARHAGVLTGADKARALSLARVLLNPGLVGLGILDAFACGLPLVTTCYPGHSPEIAYLEDGVNGLLSDVSAPAYAQRVAPLLLDDALHARLARGSREAGERYSVENMAERFAGGLRSCLEAPRWR